MKKIGIILSLLILFLLPSSVLAQKFNDNDHSYLPAQESVDGDYFAAGDTVTISGTVNGDVYAAGSTIIIDGIVNGDVITAGGNVTISGTVSDDVRVGGGTVTISGNIGKNLTIGTGKGTITSDAQIQGSVVGGAGDLTIMAPVGKNAVIGGGTLVLGNVIRGNVTAGAETLTLNNTASISGNLNYASEKEVEMQDGSSVAGQVTRHETNYQKDTQQTELTGKLMWEVVMFVITFLFGSLLLFFLPKFFSDTVNTISTKSLQSLGVGFVLALLSPIIILLLCITFIGIPFALIWFFIFIVDLLLGKIFVAHLIGERAHTILNMKANRYLTYLTGLFIYKIITFIPVVGAVMSIMATLIGFGALMIQKRVTYKHLRSKEEI